MEGTPPAKECPLTGPVRVALALLTALTGPQHDPIAGDIAEEAAAGRSAAWVWRQTGIAVASSALRGLREHHWIALRAVLVLYATLKAASWTTLPLRHFLNGWVTDRMLVILGSHPFAMLWATDLHSLPVIALVALASGWSTALFHRGTPSVMLWAALIIGAHSSASALWAASIPWRTDPPYVNLVSPTLFVVARTVLPPLCILAGSLLALRPRQPRLLT